MIFQPLPADSSLAPSPLPALDVESRLLNPAGETIFRQLVDKHQHRLYRFVVKHIGWGTDAEDITQQAFVEAAQSYATFKGESELSTWLYCNDPQGHIAVRAWLEGDMIYVRLTDWAPAFNPLLVPDPDTAGSIESRPIGGLGLLFVRRTADFLDYRRTDPLSPGAANEITFAKRCAD